MKYILVIITSIAAITTGNGQKLYLGADLSYVNEVEDCGAEFYDSGRRVDPYALFADKGANLVRVRLWHTPEWTEYSDLDDVIRTIRRAKEQRMAVLLDFHYSDTWADPSKQYIPAAWASLKGTAALGDALYDYTYATLHQLAELGLLPEMVQIGNEINSEILQPKDRMQTDTIHWQRNVALINQGIAAVNDIARERGKEIQTMIHIAQPENAFSWFKEAFSNGIKHFDWIGLSYYPKWSVYALNELSHALDSLKTLYKKRIMIVETAYPYSLENADSAGNILGKEALIPGYPATPKGQLRYLLTLTRETIKGGGEGVIYWEPAWVSTPCATLWGKGSHWENATLFDAWHQNETLPGFKFYDRKNYTVPGNSP